MNVIDLYYPPYLINLILAYLFFVLMKTLIEIVH